ncbi:QsdR family transcriptional regulator [Amnibacterium sp. CER49]|uniref:QsdR family transcriptional regulator n=1 Tax=Amnibacterium sp. CER49 TaxID=3039161 RepID=UPI002446BC5E|nr:QsdR family transcriptional regulator [Amnibacterium sp. CER49]MDH2444927.1 QsdR family transcriptional regulator [Amnibacterium sp. CER49]
MVGVDTAPRRAGLGSLGAVLVPSALSARLPDHPDAARAFRSARHRFLAGERIDMGALAAELGVDRTSLFRWVGNRDALLAEVLWSLAVPTFDATEGAVDATGADRVEQVLIRVVSDLIAADYFRDWITREPGRALRILTTRSSPVQRRFIAVTERLLHEELDAGRMATPLPVHDLAYVLVRVVESFTYADVIAGEPPSAERAAAALALVLAPTREAAA